MYGRPCPYCGAILDPGEQCDCQNVEESVKKPKLIIGKQLEMEFRDEAAKAN